jgi:hypothetical protein
MNAIAFTREVRALSLHNAGGAMVNIANASVSFDAAKRPAIARPQPADAT